ncbi:MAG: hypothetical protein ACE5JG_11540, partial [Planctomycetota bacterium]
MNGFRALACVLLAGGMVAAGPVSLGGAAAQEPGAGAVEERAPRIEEGAESGAESPAAKGDVRTVNIAVLLQEMERPVALTELDPFYTDLGVQGARLGVEDNNTTGRFTKQNFELREARVPVGGDVAAAFKALVADGHRHIVTVQVPAEDILRLADLPEAKGVL